MRNYKLEKLIKSIPTNEELNKYTYDEIRMELHFLAMYGLPTKELIEFLKNFLNLGESIEIGAGSGILANALGIKATDNYMQELPDVQMTYKLTGQPLVQYGENVKKIDGEKAIDKYKPTVVFSSWLTPKFDKDDNWQNMYGVIEERLLKKVEYYIQICGEVHYNKPILQLPHVKIHADWIRGRSRNDNYICIYTKNLAELIEKLNHIEMDFSPSLCNYENVIVEK